MNKNISIGVDIGGSHISCMGVNLEDQSMIESSLSRVSIDHNAPSDEIFPAWAEAINSSMKKLGQNDISGVGFAIPGPFDYQNGISKMEHKFLLLKDLHIPTALSPLLNCGPEVQMRFLNDALAFAVGEAWIGAGKNAEKVVVVTLGTGFGSAYIDRGVPVIERHDVAPQGCFWHLLYQDGIADDYFSTRWFVNKYNAETGRSVTGVKEIADVIQSDSASQMIFQAFGNNLAEFIGPWLKKFEADTLIMGGNIALSYDLFENTMSESFKKNDLKIDIKLSQLLENAAMVGAARLFDPIFWERHKDSKQPL